MAAPSWAHPQYVGGYDEDFRQIGKRVKHDGDGSVGVITESDGRSYWTVRWESGPRAGRTERTTPREFVPMSHASRCPGCNTAAPVAMSRFAKHVNPRTKVTCAGTGRSV